MVWKGKLVEGVGLFLNRVGSSLLQQLGSVHGTCSCPAWWGWEAVAAEEGMLSSGQPAWRSWVGWGCWWVVAQLSGHRPFTEKVLQARSALLPRPGLQI